MVADQIDERFVAGIPKIGLRRPGSDRFAALPMQVAPVSLEIAICDAQRVGTGELLAVGHDLQLEVTG